ncbi:MAG: nuclear transport factor 2 family protein [Deltaproteobacteria bacterium]|nr:nuclear transport factor 2 family protein [Deltaproteobacteria bacterium]
MRILLPAALSLLITLAAAAESSDSPGAVVEAYHAALAAGDAAAAEALLAPDAIVLESGYAETRSEYLSHHLAADIEFSRAIAQRRSNVRVVREGDVAWVSSTSRAEGEFRGKPVKSEGAELIVLSHTEGRWRIRAIHWSSHAVKAAE